MNPEIMILCLNVLSLKVYLIVTVKVIKSDYITKWTFQKTKAIILKVERAFEKVGLQDNVNENIKIHDLFIF